MVFTLSDYAVANPAPHPLRLCFFLGRVFNPTAAKMFVALRLLWHYLSPSWVYDSMSVLRDREPFCRWRGECPTW